MSRQITLGGDSRLNSGKKMKVDLKSYNRSTHDKGYLWRNTASIGTLTPFMKQFAGASSTWDINLMCEIMTHPTVGPLFGSMGVQLDVFSTPIRLYQGAIHNNKLNIGKDMSKVKLPIMKLRAYPFPGYTPDGTLPEDIDNSQINPSSLLSHLGIRGVGQAVNGTDTYYERDFHALWLLNYWDIYKNYYANKQEEEGAMIWTELGNVPETIDSILHNGVNTPWTLDSISDLIEISWTGTRPPNWGIIFETNQGLLSLEQLAFPTPGSDQSTSPCTMTYKFPLYGTLNVNSWRYIQPNELPKTGIGIHRFPLKTIDDMRESILAAAANPAPFNVNNAATTDSPYDKILNWVNDNPLASPYMATQNGLALKTYYSDLLNNWLNTDWIDDPVDGVNARSSVDTTAGSFTMDALAMAQKVWEMLNAITAADGSYRSWLEVVYQVTDFGGIESPVYHGSLLKELVFQEVISNSESTNDSGTQPLGTLAGRGVMGHKNKGGKMVIRCNEPSLIMGIFSVTPRLDYSQGNDWDTYTLFTWDDFHKAPLDQIGFQNLMQETAAWWSTTNTGGAGWLQLAAGKQPSWTNYMTEINKVKGNFAVPDNEMFMVLTRRYEKGAVGIEDMTTYIDPAKYNHIFAQTSIDAMNLWVQIAVDIEARQLMSAKQMPTL